MKVESKVSIKHALFLSILLLVLTTQTSLGEIPKQISYQGVLTDEAGKPADGSYNITFRIYSEGEPLWSETQDVEVSKGVFNTILGSREPLNLPFDKPYLLGITVDGTELQPRIPLTASPYSLNVPPISGDGEDGSPWEIKNGNVCLLKGNVGIGTTNPTSPNNFSKFLNINGTTDASIELSATDLPNHYTIGAYPTGFAINVDEDRKFFVKSDGNVGIGTTDPSHKLHVVSGRAIIEIDSRDKGREAALYLNADVGGRRLWSVVAGHGLVGPIFRIIDNTAGQDRFNIDTNGNVGIGTTNPSHKLYVNGDIFATGKIIGAKEVEFESVSGDFSVDGELRANYLHLDVPGTDTPIGAMSIDVGTFGTYENAKNSYYFRVRDIGGNSTPFIIRGNGSVGIGKTEPEADLDVDGTTRTSELDVNGTTRTRVLEITGGADLSEQFEVKGTTDSSNEKSQIEAIPGMVVCIDTEKPGELIVSKKAYDRTVAGIISGAGGVKPGMLMSQTGTIADGNHPVALTGRVYCYADAENGAIKPGDLLTTSDTPGHAMKVTDYTRAHGAILGKAMSALGEGRGLVLVLVTLH